MSKSNEVNIGHKRQTTQFVVDVVARRRVVVVVVVVGVVGVVSVEFEFEFEFVLVVAVGGHNSIWLIGVGWRFYLQLFWAAPNSSGHF